MIKRGKTADFKDKGKDETSASYACRKACNSTYYESKEGALSDDFFCLKNG